MTIVPPKMSSRQGLTLIEAAIAIVIVAALAVLAWGSHQRSMDRVAVSMAVTNARQLALACRLYAQANGGEFPAGTEPGSAPTNANTVLQDLLTTGEVDLELLFWNPRATHVCAPDPPNEDGILDPGENAFDYVAGLTDRSPRGLPLLVEAQTSPHMWDVRAGHPRHGQVVVLMVDASANVMSVERNFRVLIAQRRGDVDLLSVGTDENPGSGHLPAGAVVHRAAPVPPAAGGK